MIGTVRNPTPTKTGTRLRPALRQIAPPTNATVPVNPMRRRILRRSDQLIHLRPCLHDVCWGSSNTVVTWTGAGMHGQQCGAIMGAGYMPKGCP